MKKIVLQKLPLDVQDLIEEKAKSENVSPGKAVLEILRDAALERAIQHDIALLESWMDEEEEEFEHTRPAPVACFGCCGHACHHHPHVHA